MIFLKNVIEGVYSYIFYVKVAIVVKAVRTGVDEVHLVESYPTEEFLVGNRTIRCMVRFITVYMSLLVNYIISNL